MCKFVAQISTNSWRYSLVQILELSYAICAYEVRQSSQWLILSSGLKFSIAHFHGPELRGVESDLDGTNIFPYDPADPPTSFADENDLRLVGPVITQFGVVKWVLYPEDRPLLGDCGYVEPIGLHIECNPGRRITVALRAREAGNGTVRSSDGLASKELGFGACRCTE